MAEVKTIRVYAKEYTKKEGKGTFFGFLRINGTTGKSTHQVKCKKEAGTLPIHERGYYLIDVEAENVSIQKTKEETLLPVIWLAKFANVRKDVDYEAKIKARQEAEVKSLLDADDELPF